MNNTMKRRKKDFLCYNLTKYNFLEKEPVMWVRTLGK